MPLLAKLALPVLTDSVLQRLVAADIQTVEDLLFTKKRIRIPELIGKQVADDLLSSVEEAFAAPMVTALELFQIKAANTHCFSTGCQELDQLMGGGIFTGEILELVGQNGTGKTQLCMQAAMTVTRFQPASPAPKLAGFKVVYVDTTNSFSATRLSELFAARVIPGQEQETPIANTLNSVCCYKVFNAFSLFNFLEQVNGKLEQKDAELHNVKMIIIDSIGTLMSPIVGTKQHMGRGMLTEISRLMKKIAQRHNVAFVVTNFAVSANNENLANRNSTTELKPGLGEAWQSICHSQLFLRHQISDAQKSVSATLTRSSRSVLNQTVNFTIEPSGIVASNLL